MEIWDVNDNQRVEYSIGLNEIIFKNENTPGTNKK